MSGFTFSIQGTMSSGSIMKMSAWVIMKQTEAGHLNWGRNRASLVCVCLEQIHMLVTVLDKETPISALRSEPDSVYAPPQLDRTFSP
jgi:hypothetical protein